MANELDEMPETQSLSRDLGLLFHAIWLFDRPRIARMLALVFFASLIDGLGLFLIFPLAGIIFDDMAVKHNALVWVGKILAHWGFTSTEEKLWLFGAIYVLLILLRAVFLTFRDAATNDLKNDFVNHQRMSLYRVLAQAPWSAVSRTDRAALLNTLTSNLARLGTCLHFLLTGLVQLSQLLILIAVALFISPILSAAIIAMMLFSALLTRHRMFTSHQIGARATVLSRRMTFETDVFLSGLKAAKIYGAEEAFLDRFRTAIEAARMNSREMILQQGRSRRTLEILASVLVILMLLTGYTWLGISGPALVAMVAILLRMAPQITSLTQGLQQFVNAAPAYAASTEIKDELSRLTRSAMPVKQIGNSEIANFAKTGISLRDIVVAVKEDSVTKTLLRVDALDLPGRGIVMVVGPTGAGKSTFAELLTGLRTPTTGTVHVGQSDVQIAHNRSWQQKLSFLPQEPFLFNASVRDNLSWPDNRLSETDIMNGLGDAQAQEVVEGLANGLDEKLRDNGVRLSGGERQRICLARALARPAELYVLDEPTANLDRATEARVIQALQIRAQNALIILISHNSDLKSRADQLVEINEGCVIPGQETR